ncbi:immunoglobulin alpha-2 heavy chain-like isoform X1 [Prionailurus viverrinus]|uniref:immunoglobulin alpha-2 heavy chain-like isoform X1 n=1 Tax=Prionailurus viverrinus TaxID=61388 RepID=UPI001FF5D3EA|nr:immunoglobulin alpha-2 heavy chain-like isoform X1 [Prionailurus viverrinus]
MASPPKLPSRVPASWSGWALCVWLLRSVAGAPEVLQPSLFQPRSSVVSGRGNPQIWCVVQGSPARAHVLSWYQQLKGSGPTFLLSQREGAPPTYGFGVNPRFLAEMDPAQNAALLTVGNASPADEGTYYCAIWFSGHYVFGEGTRLLYQAKRQPLALQPPELSLFIPAYGPPFHVLCVALGHNPDPLRVSWVLEGQYQEEEDSTGGAGDPMVSWLQLPQEVAGMSVTCRGLHQSGVLEVVLPLPWGRGHRRTLEVENANKSGHILLVELEQILIATTYCYLGLLGASLIYGLILAALWRNRCCWAHPTEPLPRGGQGAAPGSRAQVGRRCTPAAAPEHKWPSPRGFHVLRGAAHAPDPPSLLRPASS